MPVSDAEDVVKELFECLKKLCGGRRVNMGGLAVEVLSNDKSLAIRTIVGEDPALCLGDSRNDEPMFEACKGGYRIKVGKPDGYTAADYFVKDHESLKKMLERLVERRRGKKGKK